MSYQKGGQRRTIETGCGWRCIGHPQEVNKKFQLHKKYCETCKDTQIEIPVFNKEAGKINGWKGITDKNQQPDKMITTTYIDGVRIDILVNGVSNVEDAMSDARLVTALNEKCIVPTEKLSKSQKKRMKQKSKKENNINYEEIITDAINDFIPDENLNTFLDKYNDDNIDEDDATWELAELITSNMTDDQVDELLSKFK